MKIMDIIEDHILPELSQPLWENWYIKDRLGSGGFSVVYLIEAERADGIDRSALKIEALTADGFVFKDPERREAYLESRRLAAVNETRIMKSLRDCPNVVRYEDEHMQPIIIDGKLEGYCNLIRMELLKNVFSQMSDGSFDYSEQNVRRLAKEIGNGIKAAHEINVIHRDIKPDNMFVSEKGVYKLGDFNISKEAASARSFAGTNYFMAPEVFTAKTNASAAYTRQADIYSFGLSLYQMMNNGYLPFEEESTPSDAMDRRLAGEPLPPPCMASQDFGRIILRACEYSPAMRYQTMDEMLADIESGRTNTNMANIPAYQPMPAPQPVVQQPAAPVMQPQYQTPPPYQYQTTQNPFVTTYPLTQPEKGKSRLKTAAFAAVGLLAALAVVISCYSLLINKKDDDDDGGRAKAPVQTAAADNAEASSPTEAASEIVTGTQGETQEEQPDEQDEETSEEQTENETDEKSDESSAEEPDESSAEGSAPQQPTAGEWSDWSETAPRQSQGIEIEQKTQYSYCTLSTEQKYSGWGNWGVWQDQPISSNDLTDVETKTVYCYDVEHYKLTGRKSPYYCKIIDVTMVSIVAIYNNEHGIDNDTDPKIKAVTNIVKEIRNYSDDELCREVSRDGLTLVHESKTIESDANLNISSGSLSYDNEEWFCNNNYTKQKYRSRSRSLVTETVRSDWSEYSDNQISAGSNTEVRTRTLYRWRTVS